MLNSEANDRAQLHHSVEIIHKSVSSLSKIELICKGIQIGAAELKRLLESFIHLIEDAVLPVVMNDKI